MTTSQPYDEERIGALLRLLPAAPEGWVGAAQELPAARLGIDAIVRRAEEDAAFRARLAADLESALEAEGVEPTAERVDLVRARLDLG